MKNILLTIEYDGTYFCGWQRQPGRRSVQGELEEVLSAVTGSKVQLIGTSRTDAGVHAYGQRASFKGDFGIPVDRIKPAVNNMLSGGRNPGPGRGDLRIREVCEMPLDFNARFDAKGKKYVYKIRNCHEADIFKKDRGYHVKKPLGLEGMTEAANYIVGTHDFKCFQAAGGDEKKTTVRTVYDISVLSGPLEEEAPSPGETDGAYEDQGHPGKEKSGRSIEIQIKGDGFLYNMVRIIAGTLVDVGLGRIEPGRMKTIIESQNRQNAGHTAPPQGLYLAEIYY